MNLHRVINGHLDKSAGDITHLTFVDNKGKPIGKYIEGMYPEYEKELMVSGDDSVVLEKLSEKFREELHNWMKAAKFIRVK